MCKYLYPNWFAKMTRKCIEKKNEKRSCFSNFSFHFFFIKKYIYNAMTKESVPQNSTLLEVKYIHLRLHILNCIVSVFNWNTSKPSKTSIVVCTFKAFGDIKWKSRKKFKRYYRGHEFKALKLYLTLKVHPRYQIKWTFRIWESIRSATADFCTIGFRRMKNVRILLESVLLGEISSPIWVVF